MLRLSLPLERLLMCGAETASLVDKVCECLMKLHFI